MKTTLISTLLGLCFAIAVALPTTAYAQAGDQKWQSATIVMQFGSLLSEATEKTIVTGVIYTPDGQTDVSGKTLAAVLEMMQEGGWRLVSSNISVDGRTLTMGLYRPIDG